MVNEIKTNKQRTPNYQQIYDILTEEKNHRYIFHIIGGYHLTSYDMLIPDEYRHQTIYKTETSVSENG